MWQEEENFEALKTLLYLNISNQCFALLWKSQHMETYSGVMWSSCKRNSGTQLSQSVNDIKREITKFVTVLLDSNWSNLTTKILE